jgi:hypothetical protein
MAEHCTVHTLRIRLSAIELWTLDQNVFSEGVEYCAQYMLGVFYIRYNKVSSVWIVQHNTVQPAVL